MRAQDIITSLQSVDYKFDPEHIEVLKKALESREITENAIFGNPTNIAALDKTYRALALKLHPDKKNHDDQLMQLINTARDIVKEKILNQPVGIDTARARTQETSESASPQETRGSAPVFTEFNELIQGDFIDAMKEYFRHTSDITSFSSALNSPYYATPEGIRTLQAAYYRYSPRSDYFPESRLLPVIENKLTVLGQPLFPVLKKEVESHAYTPAEIYSTVTLFAADYAEDPQSVTGSYNIVYNPISSGNFNRFLWAHTVYSDQHEEMARVIFLRSGMTHVIYFPGVVDAVKSKDCNAPLLIDIKKYVDEKLQSTFPGFNVQGAIHHYTFVIEKNKYIAGIVNAEGQLDVHFYADHHALNIFARRSQQQLFEKISLFSQAAGHSTTRFTPCLFGTVSIRPTTAYPNNTALHSHYASLCAIKNRAATHGSFGHRILTSFEGVMLSEYQHAREANVLPSNYPHANSFAAMVQAANSRGVANALGQTLWENPARTVADADTTAREMPTNGR
jgi:hypothetical protein